MTSIEEVQMARARLRVSLNALDTSDLDAAAQSTVAHAKMRMAEAVMLLGLAEGVPHKIHPNLQALHTAIMNADSMARTLMDADVPLDGLTAEQIAGYQAMLELAELAYGQWRVNSTLALMHLSEALTVTQKGPQQ